jgi:penicillin-binding protein 2
VNFLTQVRTKIIFILIMLALGASAAACGIDVPRPSVDAVEEAAAVPADTSGLPDPALSAAVFLDAWKKEDYEAMYALLTPISQDAIRFEEFRQKYLSTALTAALSSSSESSPVDYAILSALTNPNSAQVAYRVSLESAVVGKIQRDTLMQLSLEGSQWRIRWDDSLILPELVGGNLLRMDLRTPARGNIYDRRNQALVAQGAAVAVGVNTLQMPGEYDELLVSLLAEMSPDQVKPERLREQLIQYRGLGWYLPVGDFSTETTIPYEEALGKIPGVVLKPFRSRYYFDGGMVSDAPHITGYMGVIPSELLNQYLRLGYRQDDRVGRAGLEQWGETYLAGRRGGTLYVVDPSGKIVTNLADAPVEPAQSIYMTIEKDFQAEVQRALQGLRGAVVVIERDTGRVLAMASSPGFNPNLFEPTNYNSESLLGTLYDETTPLLNRAAQGLYPLGSVFKIITMAAALDSGQYSAQTEYSCGYFFTEIPGVTLNDWTYEHYLADGRTPASGTLTLSRGLTKSCNPWFWHIGLDFFNQDLTTAVSGMAQAFGLGSKTGIEIFEEAGFIPEPRSQIDATNFAIGQGSTLVTPLQVAHFVAAVGNGGILYQPQLMERIAPPDGEPTRVFTPTLSGYLPLSQAHLQDIHEAMVAVIGVQGTARSVGAYLTSYNIPAAGKTGTAQSGQGRPHAWFAGYTFAEREDRPDIAVAVVIENGGEGSLVAAPIFQGVVKLYFYGPPRNTFPWELEPGVLIPPAAPEPEDEGEAAPAP